MNNCKTLSSGTDLMPYPMGEEYFDALEQRVSSKYWKCAVILVKNILLWYPSCLPICLAACQYNTISSGPVLAFCPSPNKAAATFFGWVISPGLYPVNSMWLSGAIKSSLVHVMACYPMASSHSMDQCWVMKFCGTYFNEIHFSSYFKLNGNVNFRIKESPYGVMYFHNSFNHFDLFMIYWLKISLSKLNTLFKWSSR